MALWFDKSLINYSLFDALLKQKYKHDCVLKDVEPSITIECNPNEGWEEDVKDSELTRAVRRVVNSTIDREVDTKLEPKEAG